MTQDSLTTRENLIEAAMPIIDRVVRKRFFGASFSSGGGFENERARDCRQQALLEIWEKIDRVVSGVDPPFASVASYAARVAHNTVNNVVRPPNWTRLKYRVLRVISKNSRFATWDDLEWSAVAGYSGWKTHAPPVQGSLATLRLEAGALRADAVLSKLWDNMNAADWRALLERVFDAAGGPVPIPTLINFLAEVLDIRSEVPIDDELGPDDE